MTLRLLTLLLSAHFARVVFAEENARALPDPGPSPLSPVEQDVAPPAEPLPDEELAKSRESARHSQMAVHARREMLIASNETLRAIAEDMKRLHAERLEYMVKLPSVTEVSKKIDEATSRYRALDAKGGDATGEEKAEIGRLRKEIIRASREKARLLKAPGEPGSDLARLDQKIAETEKKIDKELRKDAEMVELIRGHNKNVESRMRLSARNLPEGTASDSPRGGADTSQGVQPPPSAAPGTP